MFSLSHLYSFRQHFRAEMNHATVSTLTCDRQYFHMQTSVLSHAAVSTATCNVSTLTCKRQYFHMQLSVLQHAMSVLYHVSVNIVTLISNVGIVSYPTHGNAC